MPGLQARRGQVHVASYPRAQVASVLRPTQHQTDDGGLMFQSFPLPAVDTHSRPGSKSRAYPSHHLPCWWRWIAILLIGVGEVRVAAGANLAVRTVCPQTHGEDVGPAYAYQATERVLKWSPKRAFRRARTRAWHHNLQGGRTYCTVPYCDSYHPHRSKKASQTSL